MLLREEAMRFREKAMRAARLHEIRYHLHEGGGIAALLYHLICDDDLVERTTMSTARRTRTSQKRREGWTQMRTSLAERSGAV
jgi:hypothetical protein